jgi:cobalt/nickel transport system permease protein
VGGHVRLDALHLHGSGPLHRARPQCKLLATVLFVLAVVATPREAVWAFGLQALLVAAVARAGAVPLRLVARRIAVEAPFVLFALLLPFAGRGERVEVLGVWLSADGLWGGWNILAKATLGVAATIVLTATTTIPELLRGLERLRMPSALTTIASFMVRYADVLTGEVARMRVARLSRGYDPRWLWQARAVAASAGTLFIRSYERGERVYLAMISRGWTGAMPDTGGLAASPGQWAGALAVPALAAAVALTAWLPRW